MKRLIFVLLISLPFMGNGQEFFIGLTKQDAKSILHEKFNTIPTEHNVKNLNATNLSWSDSLSVYFLFYSNASPFSRMFWIIPNNNNILDDYIGIFNKNRNLLRISDASWLLKNPNETILIKLIKLNSYNPAYYISCTDEGDN